MMSMSHTSRFNSTFEEEDLTSQTQKNKYIPSLLLTFAPSPRLPSSGFKLRKGDVLITGHGVGGLVGHAALMACDDYVLEMPGGDGWQFGIEDNNRLIHKKVWFEDHEDDTIKVYRNESKRVAEAAADWAYQNYYNSDGGLGKTVHITYKLTVQLWNTDPSYCSKLVIQAYNFGNYFLNVIRNFHINDRFIVPSILPTYFLPPYQLLEVKTFRGTNNIKKIFKK